MPTTSKRVLLFAKKLGYQTRSFEEAAAKLHVELVYVTDRCHELQDPWNDHAIAAKFESPEAAAYDAIQSTKGIAVDAVLALGDLPAIAAAYAARGLGLAHNHPAAVEACRNKLRLREICKEAGLSVPWFRKLSLHPTPEPALNGISYPCVLKPLSLSASQGVIRANSREEFLAAAERIRKLLNQPELQSSHEAAPQILVEGYIPGVEVAVEGLLTDGELRLLAIFDKPDPLEGPFFEETIYVTPSRLPQPSQTAIHETMLQMIRAVGLTQGPVHAEFRVNAEGIWPVEIAARPIGGLCSKSLRFVSQKTSETISLEELILRSALSLNANEFALESEASAVLMIPVPETGILEKVEGEANALATNGISELQITARLHDKIVAWPEGSSYLGFLFSRAPQPAEAEAALRQAHEKLQFTIQKSLPVEHPAAQKFLAT